MSSEDCDWIYDWRMRRAAELRKHQSALPAGRRRQSRAGKLSLHSQVLGGFSFKEEALSERSASDDLDDDDDDDDGAGIGDLKEEEPVIEKPMKRRASARRTEDTGGQVKNMLDRFGADINKTLLAKKKRLEMYTKASLKNTNQTIENIWKMQKEQRQKLNQDYFHQFEALFQQWDLDTQKIVEQEEKLNSLFRQQQKIFQQTRIVQSQRLKTLRQLYDQYTKSMEELEKSHDSLLNGAQNELKKEMALLQKKIMMETQQQEMANVRNSLQSMLF